jgi:hypothetical protein
MTKLEREIARLNGELRELIEGLEGSLVKLCREVGKIEEEVGDKRYRLALGFVGEDDLMLVASVEEVEGKAPLDQPVSR